MDGVFIIDKPKGITSRDVVNKVIKKLNIRKVGHTGTLDPIATGVLVVCVGSATKLVEDLTCDDKEYIATVTLGIDTDTLDIEGNILNNIDCIKTKEEIEEILKSFIGTYNQEVPAFSAVKINGKKLYEYAREGIDIELPKRDVKIKSIKLIGDIKHENNKTIFSFKCSVSKGTYIRSLIRDIALKLNTVGIMTSLRRIRQGKFKIENAINIDDICLDKLINIKDIVDYKKIEIEENIRIKVFNGAKINNIYNEEKILFVYNDVAIAIYEKEGNYMKPYKMLKGGIV